MAKKIKFNPKSAPAKPDSAPAGPIISTRGKITMAAGVVLAAIGYYVLTLTDPAGQNWASNLCPFLILGGYAAVGVGIVLPDAEKPPEATPPNP